MKASSIEIPESTNNAAVWPTAWMQKAFWWVFFICALFFGVTYDVNFPNSHYDASRHTLLASHTVCSDSECGDMADRWRDRRTHQIFYRDKETVQKSVALFVYGLIGCFAFGYFRRGEGEHAFFKYFGMAVSINLALAFFWLLTIFD
jgi:hypothetical protein